MSEHPPSIFNDVIGPVMRGPSSSHAAAAARIGRLGRQMVKGRLTRVEVIFDPDGSLATTYHGHGSDMGLVGGLLGYAPQDERLPGAVDIAREQGLDVCFRVEDYNASHPNTYRMILHSDWGERVFTSSISTGGGMIRFENIENFPVSIAGDFYETLIIATGMDTIEAGQKMIRDAPVPVADMAVIEGESGYLLNLKTTIPPKKALLSALEALPGIDRFLALAPVLPVLSLKNCRVPFLTARDMLDGNHAGRALWELALAYESARGGISESEVYNRMKEIALLMDRSVRSGLEGTVYKDRILGCQSRLIGKGLSRGRLLPGDVVNSVIGCITAIMEVKSAMGVFVAAPTAGSCGGLPGTVIGACRAMKRSMDAATKGMLAAGMIGVFIAEHATFAAEVGGCQVECGAGSGMAAAGLVSLMDGTAEEAVDAASMALQNVMGMVCDPVADRVEVPCLGKNVMAGANAVACANMALAGYDKVIPLDETIVSMYSVGKMLPPELRCTGNGGLSTTPTAMRLFREMNG